MVPLPEVGLVRPTRIRMVVDLPAPSGPSNSVTRPAFGSETDVVDRSEVSEIPGDRLDGDHGWNSCRDLVGLGPSSRASFDCHA
jgi:hypothetical protein